MILQAIYTQLVQSLPPWLVQDSYDNTSARYLIIDGKTFWLEMLDAQHIAVFKLGTAPWPHDNLLCPILGLHIADPQLCEKLVNYIHAYL